MNFSLGAERKGGPIYFWESLFGEAGFPFFFMKAIDQAEAVNHIKGLLKERGFNLPSRLLAPEQWVIFEHNRKQIGIDPASGVWVRESEGDRWRCTAKPCTVSGAIQAVEFLAKGSDCNYG